MRKGEPKPDISTPDAVKRMLLAAKAISYPDGAGGLGGAAGVSFDDTQKKLGIFEEMKPKIKRVQGVSLMQLLTRGDIDVAVTFASEINDPGVDVVGRCRGRSRRRRRSWDSSPPTRKRPRPPRRF